MKKVIIVGGGINGLFSAYYLNKLNYEITIIDNADFRHGCSHGNAGLVVPSHIIPLAAPGITPKAIRWMFNSRSPFAFHPKFSKDFIAWCLQFFRYSTKKHVENSIIPLREISFFSSKLYREVALEFMNSFSLSSKGLLMLYRNEKTAEEEIELAELAYNHGVENKVLTPNELKALDPYCQYDVIGGIHYLSDSHLIPSVLLQGLIDYLKSRNVEFIHGERITDLNVKNQMIHSVKSEAEEFKGDQFLLASGVWTSELLKKIKINLPLIAGKGYSFNISTREGFPTIPSILVDDRVAVTPMGKELRVAGTMEIGTINHKVRMNRVEGMVNSFNKYYPKINIYIPEKTNVWYGLRPCSPDGLPYIGRSDSHNNLFIAGGHAMLGLSLGPATGKLISEVISGCKPSIDLAAFNVNRYN